MCREPQSEEVAILKQRLKVAEDVIASLDSKNQYPLTGCGKSLEWGPDPGSEIDPKCGTDGWCDDICYEKHLLTLPDDVVELRRAVVYLWGMLQGEREHHQNTRARYQARNIRQYDMIENLEKNCYLHPEHVLQLYRLGLNQEEFCPSMTGYHAPATRVATLKNGERRYFCDECTFEEWDSDTVYEFCYLYALDSSVWPPECTWEDLPQAEAIRHIRSLLIHHGLLKTRFQVEADEAQVSKDQVD
jgi:hypothetical protein